MSIIDDPRQGRVEKRGYGEAAPLHPATTASQIARNSHANPATPPDASAPSPLDPTDLGGKRFLGKTAPTYVGHRRRTTDALGGSEAGENIANAAPLDHSNHDLGKAIMAESLADRQTREALSHWHAGSDTPLAKINK